jgi:hypothetical protein
VYIYALVRGFEKIGKWRGGEVYKARFMSTILLVRKISTGSFLFLSSTTLFY